MTAEAPPRGPDWPASCSVGGCRDWGRGRGTRRWLSPATPPQRPSAASKTWRTESGPGRAGFQDAHWACPAGASTRGGSRALRLKPSLQPRSPGMRLHPRGTQEPRFSPRGDEGHRGRSFLDAFLSAKWRSQKAEMSETRSHPSMRNSGQQILERIKPLKWLCSRCCKLRQLLAGTSLKEGRRGRKAKDRAVGICVSVKNGKKINLGIYCAPGHWYSLGNMNVASGVPGHSHGHCAVWEVSFPRSCCARSWPPLPFCFCLPESLARQNEGYNRARSQLT